MTTEKLLLAAATARQDARELISQSRLLTAASKKLRETSETRRQIELELKHDQLVRDVQKWQRQQASPHPSRPTDHAAKIP